MFRKRFGSLAFLLAATVLWPAPAHSQEPLRQVIIRIVDRVSWAELMKADMPTLKERILPRAAVGLMNGGLEGQPSINGIWVTLGAGRPAVGGPEVIMPAGRYPVEEGTRHPGITNLIELNLEAGTRAEPGLLGTLLRHEGILTVLVTVTNRERNYAAAAVMDSDGVIDSTLLRQDGFPGHVFPAQSLRYRTSKGAFVVVDEDYVRQADQKEPPARLFGLSRGKAAALRRFDDELAQQLAWPDGRGDTSLLIIMSASGPGYTDTEDRTFCPIIVYGPGVRRELLTSASTRTEGLISSADIAPTVLAFFRLTAPAAMSGHVLVPASEERPLAFVSRLDRETARAHSFVYPLVGAYVGWQALVFAFIAGLVLFARRALSRWRSFALFLDVMTMSLPLAFLFSMFFQARQAWLTGLLTWTLAALLGRLAWRTGWLRSLALASLWTVAVLWLDALTGGHLMRHSIIGYDPVGGTRFYGVGNEYMATMLAASAVGLGFWQQSQGKARWPFLAAGWVALILVLGAPDIGANFGGALAAAFVMPFAVWPSSGRVRAWHLPAALLSMIAFAVVVVWLDLSRSPGAQTHIGQAARLIGHGGPTAAVALVAERFSISARLFRQIPLNLVGLVVCLAAVVVLIAPAGRMADLRRRLPWAWGGLVAAAIGAVAVTVLNDSGVVAGGAAMTFVLGGLLGLALSENHEPNPSS